MPRLFQKPADFEDTGERIVDGQRRGWITLAFASCREPRARCPCHFLRYMPRSRACLKPRNASSIFGGSKCREGDPEYGQALRSEPCSPTRDLRSAPGIRGRDGSGQSGAHERGAPVIEHHDESVQGRANRYLTEKCVRAFL